MRIKTLLRAAALALIAVCGAVQAQPAEVDGPITATVLPTIGLPGSTFVLSGKTPSIDKAPKVHLVITLKSFQGQPEGPEVPPFERDAPVDSAGNWTLSFSDGMEPGRYVVQALAPDGKGSSETQFHVMSDEAYELLVAEYAKLMQESLQATHTELEAALDEPVPGLSPADQATLMVQIKRVKEAAKVIITLPGPPPMPDLPPEQLPPLVDPIIKQYRDITVESDRIRADIKASRRQLDMCQRLDTVTEVLNLTSSLMNFMGGRMAVLINHVTDKVIPAFIDLQKAASNNAKFGEATSVKVAAAAAEGLKASTAKLKLITAAQGVLKGGPGLILDAINHGSKWAFDKYCTRFEGPFTATLSSEFYTDASKSQMYWGYITKIGGLMRLTQPKYTEAGSDTEIQKAGSQMFGRFDGAAIGYEVSEDAMKLAPKLRSTLIYHKLIAPPAEIRLPPTEFGAVFNAGAHPLGFYIETRAERKGDQVVLNFADSAKIDMNPKFNRGLLIHVFNAGLIPVLNYQELPMQDAYFMLTRGMRKNAVLKISTDGKEQHLKGTFSRDEKLDEVTLHWDVEIDACNPACTTTSIDRMKAWYTDYRAKQQSQ